MMADDPELRQRRPLSTQLQQYAAADVSQLLNLADLLCTKVGDVGQATVMALSQASCQLKLPIKPGTQVPLDIPPSCKSQVNRCACYSTTALPTCIKLHVVPVHKLYCRPVVAVLTCLQPFLSDSALFGHVPSFLSCLTKVLPMQLPQAHAGIYHSCVPPHALRCKPCTPSAACTNPT